MANLGYIQVTRTCNQHCLFCSNPENQRTLDLGDAQAQIEKLQAAGYDGVILTGGEPTLHPDLVRIVAMARQAGLPPRMISNGQRTADTGLLESLQEAGLTHLHLSVHSVRGTVQAEVTGNPDSWAKLEQTFDRVGDLGLTCDVNTVICAMNADHLDENVIHITRRWPFVRHFVWNNLDSKMNRVVDNPHTVARLADLELSLVRATRHLLQTGRSFRIERLPLCYMADVAWASTETRKIVKGEERTVHFLDDKGEIHQTDFFHDKAAACQACHLDPICAGLYDAGGATDPKELHALFVDRQAIVDAVLGKD